MTSMRFTRSENDWAPSTYIAAFGSSSPLYVATTILASWARAAARLCFAILSRSLLAAIRCLTPESVDWARS